VTLRAGGDEVAAGIGRKAIDRFVDHPLARRVQIALAVLVAFYALVGRLFSAPPAILFLGAVLGSLSALVAMGIVLIYRANRFINFAQGDLGGVAAVLGVSLLATKHWPFLGALPAGIGAALVLGAAVEFLFIRRFAKAPRLILTVASIGIAQLLQGLQLALPSAFGLDFAPQDFPTPFDFRLDWHPVVFRGNHLLAIIVVVGVAVGLGAFFRFTRVGIAVRGAAESSDRAWMLGVPVARINTVVWVLAAGLSGLAALLRAPIVGISIGTVLGPSLLLRALAAAVIGRMESLPVTFAAAVGLGMVEQAVFWDTSRTLITDAVLFGVIIVGLFLQRRGRASRVGDEATSSWSASREVRPVPPELRALPEVVSARYALAAAAIAFVVIVPLLVDASRVNLMGVGVVYALVGMSLLVLTGWAGQISLGQMAFFGFGMATAGTLAENGWDFFAAVLAGALVGAAVAIVIGVPALRIRGPFLAVATLGFALASSSYFLNEEFFGWFVPTERLSRPILFGKFDLESERVFFFFLLALLLFSVRAVRSLRASRAGRALVAARDNPRAAQAYGVNLTKIRLFGFALSGFIAALAGSAFMFHQHRFAQAVLRPEFNIRIFSMAVIGGLGSVPGILVAAAYFATLEFFIASERAQLFTSGTGLLLILLLFPGGLGQILYDLRDAGLRRIARRREIVVPSLVADVQVTTRDELMPTLSVNGERIQRRPARAEPIARRKS
jgi:branched-chain amino acid transport system permease protein